jgi:hypothetical protein
MIAFILSPKIRLFFVKEKSEHRTKNCFQGRRSQSKLSNIRFPIICYELSGALSVGADCQGYEQSKLNKKNAHQKMMGIP